jgi:hypothetical protein
MDEKTKKAIKALGVVIHTDHIKAYLAAYDPQAYRQVHAAFYGLS